MGRQKNLIWSLLLILMTFSALRFLGGAADQGDTGDLRSGWAYELPQRPACRREVAAIAQRQGEEVLARRGEQMVSFLLIIALLFLALSGTGNNKLRVDLLREAILRSHLRIIRHCIIQRGPPVVHIIPRYYMTYKMEVYYEKDT